MKKVSKLFFVFLIILVGFNVFAPITFAAGLVPCGNPDQSPCTVCDFYKMADGIIKFITIDIVPPLAVLLIIIGGVMFIFSGGSEERITKGKAILTSTIVGLIIVYTSWILVDTIFKKIADQQFGPWNKIEC